MEKDAQTTESPQNVPVWRWEPRERWTLLGILLLAFGLRLWNAHAMSASDRFEHPVMDGAYHLDWARALLAGESFQEGAYFRAPLYPWFLAGVLKATGGSLFAVRIVQALLGTLTVALTLLIARHCFGRAAGWLAGCVAATYWVLIYFDGELLIPTVYVPLLLAGLYGSLRLPAKGFALRACAWTGLCFGLAAIARPNVLLFLPLLGIWVPLQAGRGKRAWAAAVVLTLGTLAPIVPITIHNAMASGEFVLISTQAGVNFWIGNNPASDGVSAIVPGTRAGWWEGFEDSRRLARQEEGRELSDVGISRHYARKAWAWMFAEPGVALRHELWKMRLFWTDWELSNNQEIRFLSRYYNPLSRLSLSFAWLAGLGLLGAVLALGSMGWRWFPLWGFLGTYTVGVVAFFVCSRFRVPILPVLIVLGSGASVQVWDWIRARRWIPMAAGLGFVLLVGWWSSRVPVGVVTDDSNGYMALGDDALERGDLDRAEGFYKRGLGASTRNGQLRLSWSRLLRERNQKQAARHWLAETVQMHPGFPEARVALSDLENELGQHAAALRLAQEGLRLAPAQTGLRYQAGRALIGLGDIDRGLAEFSRVMESDPLDFVAPFAKGWVLMGRGERDAALQAFHAAKANQDRASEADRLRLEQCLLELER